MRDEISVCMATYNGEKFILNQIESILPQLNNGDELLIIDDGSKDSTLDIIRNIGSPYINIITNKSNLGHVKTFEKLLSLAKNEIVFMCDQDDIWSDNKIEIYKKKFQNENVLLISDNSYFIDQDSKEISSNLIHLESLDSKKYKKNILNIYKGSAGYYGCGMALKKELLKIVLPIPNYVESHDLWIAMVANLMKSNLHIDNKTFYRRIHGENDSLKKRPLFKKIYSRLIFIKSHLEIHKRIKVYVTKAPKTS